MKKVIVLFIAIVAMCFVFAACECEHQYEEAITSEASCAADGVKTFTCKLCDESYTEAIPKKEHIYNGKITSVATCTNDGVKTFICELCDDAYTELIPKKEHVFTEKITKSPTCTLNGEKKISCTLCSEFTTEVIPKLDHTTTSGVCERCYSPVGLSAKELKKIITIAGVNVSKPNSAGGCNVTIAFKNTSKKEIKYIYYTVTPYNGVKDVVCCDIRDYSSTLLQKTGPIEPGYANYVEDWGYNSDYYVTVSGRWSNVWYNYGIKYIKLNKIKIEYMDGSILIINEDLVKDCFIPCKDNHIT